MKGDPVTSKPEISSILIVDSDPNLRNLLAYSLRAEGYEVAHANHGEEALDYLVHAKKLPLLILIDPVLPVMDGWRFREIQKDHLRLCEIPVILFSSAPIEEEYRKSFQALAYCKKPLNISSLLDIANRLKDPGDHH